MLAKAPKYYSVYIVPDKEPIYHNGYIVLAKDQSIAVGTLCLPKTQCTTRGTLCLPKTQCTTHHLQELQWAYEQLNLRLLVGPLRLPNGFFTGTCRNYMIADIAVIFVTVVHMHLRHIKAEINVWLLARSLQKLATHYCGSALFGNLRNIQKMTLGVTKVIIA